MLWVYPGNYPRMTYVNQVWYRGPRDFYWLVVRWGPFDELLVGWRSNLIGLVGCSRATFIGWSFVGGPFSLDVSWSIFPTKHTLGSVLIGGKPLYDTWHHSL